MRHAFARHLLSVALLPFAVAVIVPALLQRDSPASLYPEARTREAAAMLTLGAVCAALGLALFVTSLRRFATEGEGTLAPWDPPRRLVVRGPYRYVRNPMISGVLFVLVAESLLLDSRPLLVWAAIFLAANLAVIPLVEEPGLRKRFGAAYVEYCAHVPRFIPRIRPWTPPD